MSKLPETSEARRPIAARNTKWADKITRGLSNTGITPNMISVLSMVFSFATLVFYWLYASQPLEGWPRGGLLVLAILAIQMRLLCNLFDGMVAVEGGKAGRDGPFWNEFPDRVADIFILVGAGIAAGNMTLGWVAASLAVFIAYVRELGRANGLPANYLGPMAKQHRMAVLSLGTLIAVFEPLWTPSSFVLLGVIYLIIGGSLITIIRRAYHQVTALKNLQN